MKRYSPDLVTYPEDTPIAQPKKPIARPKKRISKTKTNRQLALERWSKRRMSKRRRIDPEVRKKLISESLIIRAHGNAYRTHI